MMVFELTMANLIALATLFLAALWALARALGMQQEKRLGERFSRVEERLAELERTATDGDTRLAHMESAMRGALSHDDLGEVYARLNALAEGVNKLAGEFGGAQRTLQLLHEYLLNGSRK